MKAEKKFLADIPQYYKQLVKELADFRFFYTVVIWKKRYGMDTYAIFIRTLCEMFECDKTVIMNLLVDMQVYPERYRHDIRPVAFLMYAMDVPIREITWILHVKQDMIHAWVKTQLKNPPEIKRLFTDAQTSEIIKLLTAWEHLKGVPI